MNRLIAFTKHVMSRSFVLALCFVGTLCSADAVPVKKGIRQQDQKKPHIVFLISEDSLNYEAHKTIPVFAEKLWQEKGYRVSVLQGRGPNNAFSFPGMEVIAKADLVVLFSRRIALPEKQLQAFKDYLRKGGPLVAIRTGNHAFTTRGDIKEGYNDWPEFVSEILGCGNYGYGSPELGTDVLVAPQAAKHPILNRFPEAGFHSIGNLYRVTPLTDKQATVLLNGRAGDETQPIAWVRTAGKSRVFYTTLGHPDDFLREPFLVLLSNAIEWGISR
jgi:type 1 glutamine amidotransferase